MLPVLCSAMVQPVQCLLYHFFLTHPAAIQFTSHNNLKILPDGEIVQNLLHKHGRLTGRHRQMPSFCPKFCEQLRNAVVYFVLVEPHRTEPLPIDFHRSVGFLVGEPVEFPEAVFQGRPDKGLQLVQILFHNTKALQRVPDALRNSFLRIGQCSVQIK